jgi:hypothetical protein
MKRRKAKRLALSISKKMKTPNNFGCLRSAAGHRAAWQAAVRESLVRIIAGTTGGMIDHATAHEARAYARASSRIQRRWFSVRKGALHKSVLAVGG